ncbi:MAG: alpha-L-rhamnosidase N-terminal domain-containing protein, partial [Clostridia bacterium]|nr:alpha-L-rhamnosidase N-terminal domain-containing protein [Clostridia bacterium]
SYKTTLQYQAYDVTELVREGDNELSAVVAGGWAVGAFVFTRKNRVTADRQALLAELRLTYADGSTETIGSDASWQVTRDGNYRMCDFYDGETYDATVELDKAVWRNAGVEKVKIRPNITAEFGSPVVAIERLKPISCVKRGDELIYDFGQNFAGVIAAEINGAR